MNSQPHLSVIVPNYRTLDFTRLCLRALRKHSRLPMEVIVVDNNSADASLDYLRRLTWIRLFENKTQSAGSLAHREALDIGSANALGDWIVFFHSDTIVLQDGWDRTLIDKTQAHNAVGFSSTVRNIDPFEPRFHVWIRAAKSLLSRQENEPVAKLMSYCFGVRRDLLQSSGFRFVNASDAVTDFYDAHIRGRRPFFLLGRSELEPLLWHTSNVTSIVTEQMSDPKMLAKFRRRSAQLYAAESVRSLLTDDSLDL
jgi:glycosyltransferase involved in cell wall biosynthesis